MIINKVAWLFIQTFLCQQFWYCSPIEGFYIVSSMWVFWNWFFDVSLLPLPIWYSSFYVSHFIYVGGSLLRQQLFVFWFPCQPIYIVTAMSVVNVCRLTVSSRLLFFYFNVSLLYSLLCLSLSCQPIHFVSVINARLYYHFCIRALDPVDFPLRAWEWYYRCL